MLEKPATDKVRVVDLSLQWGADRHDAPWVHTVEISDERSAAHFVTIFCAGKTDEMLRVVEPLMERVDLTHHDPETYHRDDRDTIWVNQYFGDKIRLGWGYHFHWQFDHQPTRDDLVTVLDELSSGVSDRLKAEVLGHFDGQKAEAA